MSALTVADLKKACDDAYDNPIATDSCSHAVWLVLKQAWPDEPYRKANDLIDQMINHWDEVDLEKAGALANQGTIVVGGKKETGNGHVIVVYPGPKIPGGGYPIQVMDKIKKQMKTITMPSHGNKWPCLSTLLGDWPGAMSKGDKNVFDPWGNDQKFAHVRFWTMKSS